MLASSIEGAARKTMITNVSWGTYMVSEDRRAATTATLAAAKRFSETLGRLSGRHVSSTHCGSAQLKLGRERGASP